MALTPKQEKFAQCVVEGMSQADAYRAAYNCKPTTKPETIQNKASALLRKGEVRARVEELKQRALKRHDITVDRVLKEYGRLAFFDPRKLFDGDGKPKPIQMLDDDTAAALAGLDLQEVYEGYGEEREFVGYTKKYKLADKKGALDSIARHLGMFKDRVEHTGKDGGPVAVVQMTPEAIRKVMEKDDC